MSLISRLLLSGLFAVCLNSQLAWAEEDLEGLLGGTEQKAKTEKLSPEEVLKRKNNVLLAETVKTLVGNSGSRTEQNVFYRYVESGDWDKALLQYSAAFGATPFERSENARALQSLLMVKSGLSVLGMEQLFSIRDPKKIHFFILSQIKEVAPEKHPVWKVATLGWTEAWSEIFGMGLEVRSKTGQISYKKSLELLKDLEKRTTADSAERGLVEWHLALAYSLNEKPTEAAKVISGLLKAKQSPVSEDLLNLTAARLLYQNGYFDAAIRYNQKVSKAGDYWLEAQEEMAWAFIRKGEPQNALAVTKTLTQPVFKGQVGAESHFVQALAQLKVCDYPGVVKSLKLFPELFKERTVSLKKLSQEASNPLVAKVVTDVRDKKIKWEDLGKDAFGLPRWIHRDQKLRDFSVAQGVLESESQVAELLYSKSLAQTGLQATFEKYKSTLLTRAQTARTATFGRVEELAKTEVQETEKILAKMHIIEAELIQQVSMAEKLTKAEVKKEDIKTGTTGSSNKDVLKFKVTSDEVWFDELSNFQVTVKKACQKKKE